MKFALVSRLRKILAIFGEPESDPELICAQFVAYSRQMPILYVTGLVNALALAITHLPYAPLFLTVALPALLCICCTVRLIFWTRAYGRPIVLAETLVQARKAQWLAVALGASFTVWSLSLFPYGNVATKFHVAFYLSITVITCTLCMMHLRAAAIRVTAVVIVPYVIFFCSTGNPVFITVAVNFALLSVGLMYILMLNHETFSRLNRSQRELTLRQAETQRLSDENCRLASQDALTGLPNRRMFLMTLETVLQRTRGSGPGCALALVDLDGFKHVNDTYGHAAGDRLLAEVGSRLLSLQSGAIFVARLGGDEFGVAALAETPDFDVTALGRRLSLLLKGPYLVGDICANVSGSVGLVTYTGGQTNCRQLLERADFALYTAKETRTGHAVVFSHEHEAEINGRRRLEQALHRANFDAEMWPVFQPIIDSLTGRVIGFEALARWTSPTIGTVAPDIFIKGAERERLVGEITRVMLKKSLHAAAGWPANLGVSFNLSAQDIINPETMGDVCRIIEQGGVAPGRISIEITETAVLLDFVQAVQALKALRQLGVSISLDDFGTGYSSLAHVHQLKPDSIKIDRSFIVDLQSSKTSRDIVRTIVTLCQNLELGCVVEGVETKAQERLLVTLGCRTMQGYLFGKPMRGEAVAGFLGAFAASPLIQAHAG